MARTKKATMSWVETGLKVCSVCSTEKPISEFKFNGAGSPGWCYSCTTEKARGYARANREYRNEYYKEWYLKSNYGLSKIEYKALVTAQENKCAICNREPNSKLYVDHDHATGEVRGLLCQLCNSGIGMLQDDIEIVEKALAYLKTTNTSNRKQ